MLATGHLQKKKKHRVDFVKKRKLFMWFQLS